MTKLKTKKRTASKLEKGFDVLFAAIAKGRPSPLREHYFAKAMLSDKGKPRMWRFDFAWPGAKLAIEIDGGIFMKRGGHTNPIQFTQNCEKLNAAVELGWRVLRFTTLDLRTRPVQCVEQVCRLLDQRPGCVEQRDLFGGKENADRT